MLRIITYVIAAYILFPVATIIMMSFSSLNFVMFPPSSFTVSWYLEVFEKSQFVDSFYLSFAIALLVSVVATIVALIIALYQRKSRSIYSGIVTTIVMSPLVLPSMIIGLSLLQYVIYLGIPLSWFTIVLGHIIITVPYGVRLISDAVDSLPENIERAAAAMGASEIKTLLLVIFPNVKGGIAGSAIFAFLLSFENVTVSAFLSSPGTVTLPVRIFGFADAMITTWLIAVCSMVVYFTIFVVWLIQRTIGVDAVVGVRR